MNEYYRAIEILDKMLPKASNKECHAITMAIDALREVDMRRETEKIHRERELKQITAAFVKLFYAPQKDTQDIADAWTTVRRHLSLPDGIDVDEVERRLGLGPR